MPLFAESPKPASPTGRPTICFSRRFLRQKNLHPRCICTRHKGPWRFNSTPSKSTATMSSSLFTYLAKNGKYCCTLNRRMDVRRNVKNKCMQMQMYEYVRQMYVCMCVCVYMRVFVYVWMSQCLYVRMHVCMYVGRYVGRDGWMDDGMDAWMHGWMMAWMRGCMDVCMHEYKLSMYDNMPFQHWNSPKRNYWNK